MIVVSGGSRGIGRAICRQLLADGKEVLAIARGESGLRQLSAETKEYSGLLHTYAADLSTAAACGRLCEWVVAKKFTVTALVNNAGQYDPAGLLAPADRLEELLQLNLLAAHRLTRGLLNDGMTHLITIGSVAALDLPERMPAYTVSKYALHGWHEMISRELNPRGVVCSLIIPGATLTSAWEGETDIPEAILLPEEISEAVCSQLAERSGAKITIRPNA